MELVIGGPSFVVDGGGEKCTISSDYTTGSLPTDALPQNSPCRASEIVPCSLVVRDIIEICR